ncbi:MAG: VWA domain-containing protein [Candidatus Cloacimonetes bacterium]|nr:VWA domain-containing protein [Candidatus Cloacimonadota bacterium]
MNLHDPQALWLLLLIPVLVLLVYLSRKRLEKRFVKYAEQAFMALYLSRRSPFYSGLKLAILILAAAFVIISISRPQWDYRERELSNSGMDIVFAIDVSRSMEATDIQPSRLLRSILQVSAFVNQLEGDRIGLISFAGAATIECPLTDDYEAFQMVLSSLDTSSAPRAGTDIARALDVANSAFAAAAGEGVLILISDGEDLSPNAVARAKELGDKGIRIYTMGVGSEEGAIISNPYTGEERVSKLDIGILDRIARISGADFFRITPSAAEIQLLLSRIYDREKTRSEVRKVNLYKEQYHIFVIIALILIIVESLILPLKRNASGGFTP